MAARHCATPADAPLPGLLELSDGLAVGVAEAPALRVGLEGDGLAVLDGLALGAGALLLLGG